LQQDYQDQTDADDNVNDRDDDDHTNLTQ
jgi:hypothetical protein